jgi:two-component system response regulator
METPFVLLVEDNADDVTLMLRIFARTGLPGDDRVVVTRDGVEALDFLFPAGADHGRAARPLPRVIFLDLKMPRLDGLEVLRRVRADPRTRLVPVVMLTSSDEERDVTQSYQLGANSYIRKPEDSTQFSETVGALGRYWFHLNQVVPDPIRA